MTRSAYRSVFSVCSDAAEDGPMAAIITVRQLPVNESFSTSVSFEPRNADGPPRDEPPPAPVELQAPSGWH